MRREKFQIEISSSAPGNTRFLTYYLYEASEPQAKTIYLQASIHADEWPGMLALQHLLPMLDQLSESGALQSRVIVVPYANPIGLAQWVGGIPVGRYAFDGSGNFNRTWPSLASIIHENDLWQTANDPQKDERAFRLALRQAVELLPTRTENDEMRKALLGLSASADYVLDLHCDGQALMHLYANDCHEGVATRLSHALGVSVLLLERDSGGHPFDETNACSWWEMRALDRDAHLLPDGCFACTVELRGKMDIEDHYAHQDAVGILDFMQQEGLIADEALLDRNQSVELITTQLEAVALQHAPVTGLAVYHARLGEHVSQGQHIADIVDVSSDGGSDSRVPIYAETTGLLFTKDYSHYVRKGTGLLKIAGRDMLAHRKKGTLLND